MHRWLSLPKTKYVPVTLAVGIIDDPGGLLCALRRRPGALADKDMSNYLFANNFRNQLGMLPISCGFTPRVVKKLKMQKERGFDASLIWPRQVGPPTVLQQVRGELGQR